MVGSKRIKNLALLARQTLSYQNLTPNTWFQTRVLLRRYFTSTRKTLNRLTGQTYRNLQRKDSATIVALREKAKEKIRKLGLKRVKSSA